MTRRDRKLLAGVVIALMISIALAMGTSVLNGFVNDDIPIIVNNPRVTNLANWWEIPSTSYWLNTLWRPLTVAGYALQWWLGDGRAWLFHVVNLLLYLTVGLLAIGLMHELRAGFWAVAIAIIAFVVHPVHVEVVANVVGQAELWMAASLVVTMWVYLRTRRLGFTVPRLVILLAAILMAVMAKEQGFVAPLLLFGAEWLLCSGRSETWGARIRLLLPATALSTLMLIVRSTVTGSMAGEIPAVPLQHLGFRDRLVTFIGTVPEYARLLVWPVHLQAEYSPPGVPVAGPITARHLAGILLIGLMVTLFVLSRRRAPILAFGFWWAAVAIAPVSSVLTAAGIVMAERVFFLPTLGFTIALAGAGPWIGVIAPRRIQFALVTVMVLWTTGAAVRSALRVPVWHDQDRFFTQLPIDAPNAYGAFKMAGTYWKNSNHRTLAEKDLREAVRLWPHDASTNEFLGQFLRESGRCQEAVPIFVQGLALEPDRTQLRARLLECLLAVGDQAAALTVAEAGIALGDSSFMSARQRIRANPARH